MINLSDAKYRYEQSEKVEILQNVLMLHLKDMSTLAVYTAIGIFLGKMEKMAAPHKGFDFRKELFELLDGAMNLEFETFETKNKKQ